MRKTISLSNSDCTFTARKRNALCAKNHLFVQKLKSGLERSKVIWVASTRKRSNLHIGKPFGIAGGGGGEVFNKQLELKIKLCCAFCLQKSRKKSKE
jgi:hypothetical protein